MISDSNPENSMHKTPKVNKKEKMGAEMDEFELSIKKLISSKRQYEREREIFTTPVMKNPTIARSVMKANGKNLRRNEDDL
jgi:hypothetical protein